MNEVENLIYIDTGNLHEHPANPRKNVGDVSELAESIKVNGVLQNLIVIPGHTRTMEEWIHICKSEGVAKNEAKGTYEPEFVAGGYTVIIGHRRLAAAKMAGLTEVPCVITSMTEKEQLSTMLLENMQRSDLTLLEEADGFQMMLDMGESVSSIAEQTGISETTVRRRLSLTKLDRNEMKKAQERGATLQDYARLDQVKDPETKNKVLGYIGTADFNQKLQSAVREEKDREWFEHIVQQFRESGWCQEIHTEERNDLKGSTIEYQRNYSAMNKYALAKPADADQVQYYYFIGKTQVDLYRTKTAEEAPISQEEQRRRQLKEKLDTIIEELEYQDQDFRDLRETFIEEFSAFNLYREEIQAFAVKAMLYRLDGGYHYFDMEELAGMLEIACTEDEKLEPKQLNEQLWKCPEKVLLCLAYILLEDGRNSWWRREWNSSIRACVPVYEPNKKLDLLYACLKSLGYEMSSEEQSASGGGCMQFIEAQKLIEQYKEEQEKAGAQL